MADARLVPLEAMVKRAQCTLRAALPRLKVMVARATASDWWVELANTLEVSSMDWRPWGPIDASCCCQGPFAVNGWRADNGAMPLRAPGQAQQ